MTKELAVREIMKNESIRERLNKHRKEAQITCREDCLCWDVEALLAQLEEFLGIYDKIMDENCPSDEKHCTCVPFLKAELQKKDTALRRIARLGYDIMGIALRKRS